MGTSKCNEVVSREKYGQAALRVTSGAGIPAAATPPALEAPCDPITSNFTVRAGRPKCRHGHQSSLGMRQPHCASLN